MNQEKRSVMEKEKNVQVSINIDTGGTFTDCVVFKGDKNVMTKAPTTSNDLSICTMQVISDGAQSLGMSVEELLSECNIIRYATTLATNALIERKGAKLGLITTEGFEDTTILGRGSQWADGLSSIDQRNLARIKRPDPLIPRELIVGAKERIDSSGRVLRPLDEEDLLEKVTYLVDKRVTGIVVSLISSFINPIHEQRIRKIVEKAYPNSYLGAVAVFLSSEVLPKRNEYTRTMTTILNAYLGGLMRDELSSLSGKLRDTGHSMPIRLVHNTGGMTEIFKTSAIHTCDAGLVAGLIGSSYIGKQYGFDNIILTDMGGTSFDVGLVVGGSTSIYQFNPIVDRWLVDITMLDVESIGAGGGSIARINKLFGNRLEVGPRSAGAMPGPVAYDIGGTEPTVTDADVVLGLLNPDYFHGGRMKLNKEKAIKAIEEQISGPLGIEVEEAALLIKKVVDGNMGATIFKKTMLSGHDPREFVLFAYGGAGPAHCGGYSAFVGVKKIIVSPYAPVFCAFGSSYMDLLHIYEQSKRVTLLAPITKVPITDYEEFNSVVRSLREKALRDIIGEGFLPEQIIFNLELDMKFGGQLNTVRTSSPRLFLQSESDVITVQDAFTTQYSQAYSPLGIYHAGGIEIENFILKAAVILPKYTLPSFELKGENPKQAFKGERDVFWEEYSSFEKTKIYERELLECGNVVEGAAIIEAENTTVVVSPGKICRVDKYQNCVIEDI